MGKRRGLPEDRRLRVGAIQSRELALRVVQCAGAAGWLGVRAGLRPGRFFSGFPWPHAQAHFSRLGLVGGWAVSFPALERNSIGTLFKFL